MRALIQDTDGASGVFEGKVCPQCLGIPSLAIETAGDWTWAMLFVVAELGIVGAGWCVTCELGFSLPIHVIYAVHQSTMLTEVGPFIWFVAFGAFHFLALAFSMCEALGC